MAERGPPSTADAHAVATRAKQDFRVFISYSRSDVDFADQLSEALQLHDFEVTLDRHAIAGAEDWESRLGDLITQADTVVFVLSPDSAASSTCAWEIEEAARQSKRLIPVMCRAAYRRATCPRRVERAQHHLLLCRTEEAGFRLRHRPQGTDGRAACRPHLGARTYARG